MPVAVEMSSSMSLLREKKEFNPDSHFRWRSIKKFLIMACTFSSSMYNFDIFSKAVNQVRIFEFVFCEVTIGISYMFMDSFMKLYTRKMDAHKYLNPLLKGITYGLFLQTALWAVLHANYVADSMRYLIASFREVPSWAMCHISVNVSCVSSKDVLLRCQDQQPTDFNTTSAHFNYIQSFNYLDRTILTARFFVIGLVWMFNFFFSTVTDVTLLKIFKLAFMCRVLSTMITLLFLLVTTKYLAVAAFIQILDANTKNDYTVLIEHVTYTYGIGFLGFYDFGNMSPYTMIDNAVLLFMLMFTILAFVRSWIVKILYLMLTKCVSVEISITPHYFIFAVLPLSAELLHAHKLYTFYIYLNIILSTAAYLTMLTLTMSKLLQAEFRSVKNMYIIGLLCFLGFGFSLPITVGNSNNLAEFLLLLLIVECMVIGYKSMTTGSRVRGLITGLNVTVLYLGGFKVAIIMWVYGVQRFSTDIHFWLGFKPTKFWNICWMFMPITLSFFLLTRIYMVTQETELEHNISAGVWIVLSILIVAIFHIKTIAKYLVRNNFAAAFRSSIKYGPPDPDDRKKRRNFNETIHLRKCHHSCLILDDKFDCNHLPLVTNMSQYSVQSEPSLRDIFEEGPSTRLRTSIALDIDSHQ